MKNVSQNVCSNVLANGGDNVCRNVWSNVRENVKPTKPTNEQIQKAIDLL